MPNQVISFDDITQQVFMERVKKLANDMAEEMGVDINRVGNVSATENMITFNIAFKVKGAKTEYKTRTHSTGPIHTTEIKVGFKFSFEGTLYEVVGFNPRNYKNSVSLKRCYDGKGFKTSYDNICRNGKRYDK